MFNRRSWLWAGAAVALGAWMAPASAQDSRPITIVVGASPGGSTDTLARTIAQKSIVLLKNDCDLLPLPRTIKSLALIGPSADSVRNLIGDYAYPCHVESLAEMTAAGGNMFNVPTPAGMELADTFVPIKSILEALTERLDPAVKIHYAQGCGIIDPADTRRPWWPISWAAT